MGLAKIVAFTVYTARRGEECGWPTDLGGQWSIEIDKDWIGWREAGFGNEPPVSSFNFQHTWD